MIGPSLEWLSLLVRWGHVVIGALWIGASFYLISWENKFNRTRDLPDDIEGDFWTIQGGDFYKVEKLKHAPPRLPAELHWFKYEAYLTWLSGFALLCLLYYANARTMLVGGAVASLTPGAGIAIGIGSLVVSWVAYDLYCRTRFARDLRLSAIVGLLFVAAMSCFFTQVFGARAAFIHVGAVLGTLMSGNVFFGIIPWHRKLIRAIEAKQPLDDLYARRPGFRSRHNHYMTVPVFFIMLSGHFPMVFGHAHNWALLTAMTLAAGLMKHAHTLMQRSQSSMAYLLAGGAALGGIVLLAVAPTRNRACAAEVPLAEAFAIVSRRCASCHSSAPTDDVWRAPPNGLVFDTPKQTALLRDRIMERAVVARTMPPENKTGMTPEERELLHCWITGEAKARPK